MQDGVLGVWKLRSFRAENVETKARMEPFGPEPRGTLILHPDGRMAALLTPGPRPARAGGADAAGDTPKIIACSGRFRLEPPDRFVTTVDVAWVDDWVGTDQARTYTLDGDGLELTSAPGRMVGPDGGEATFVGRLTWTRETPTPVQPAR